MANSTLTLVSTSNVGGATTKTIDISSIAVGESMIVLSHNDSGSNVTAPAGWSPLFTQSDINSRRVSGFYKKKASSGETSVVLTRTTTNAWGTMLLKVAGADPANWIFGTIWLRAAHGTSFTNVAGSITTTVNNTLVACFSFEATNAMESPNSIVSINNSFSDLAYLPQVALNDRIETIYAGTKVQSTAGAVGDTTITYQNTQATNGAAVLIGFPPVPDLPIGTAIKDGTGATRYLSFLDSDGTTRKAPASVSIWLPGYPDVSSLLADASAHPTMAHRGGSSSYPEMSQYAYDHSVFRGHGVLEFSCGWTSDNVPFGLGYQYLDDVSAATGSLDPTTITWATLSSTYQIDVNPSSPGVYQPFFRLEEFLAKYTKTHICIVDPKYGFANQTKINTMLDICDANGGPSKIIIKFDSPETDGKLTTSAAARGYTKMNYWASDTTSMAAQQSRWDIIGALYSDSAAMTAANSYGKPSWAAIIPDSAGVATAIANGGKLMMVRATKTISPVSYWN